MTGPPRQMPIGLFLNQVARTASRAFDEAMSAQGGSAATWGIFIALKMRPLNTQRELAEAVGIKQATLTHHLNGMEDAGLVRRWRETSNRRVQRVALTPAGDAMFERLRGVTFGFDQRLRAGFTDDELDALRAGLARLMENVSGGRPEALPVPYPPPPHAQST